MQKVKESVLFSPSDLVNYSRSPFITWMERNALENPEVNKLKDAPDPMLSQLAQKGYEHEEALLQTLRCEHDFLVEIDSAHSKQEQQKNTISAMRQGADVIFQAYLTMEGFAGYADFLVKVPQPSQLGDYSYVPWDTKLAKQPRPYFIIQLCCYAEMLQQIQGCLPEEIAVVLGDKSQKTYRTNEFFAYYKNLKHAFLCQQNNFDINGMPDQFLEADVGDWSDYVESLRQERDHLSKIANITKTQIARLQSQGISTCSDLVNDTRTTLPALNTQLYLRLKAQAALQLKSERSGSIEYEVLPEPDKAERLGFHALPPHSPNDLFFDLEGFPFEEGGLEYLWGVTYFAPDGKRLFWERWAHDHAQERQAFIDFASFVYRRWKDDPTMHVYHYAHYEITVLKRLMGRYGAMETQIDDMLRAGVFVDLYQVVRHAIRIGAPSYSIKKVELLYREARETDVASGGESVVVYANWRDEPDGETWKTSKVLSFIRDYNIDDCESTQELVEWLRGVQSDSGIVYQPPQQPTKQSTPSEDQTVPTHKVIEHQLRDIAASQNQSEEDKHIATILADVIDFHERENKPMWWRFFERQSMTFDELYDDPDCIVDCVITDDPVQTVPVRGGKMKYLLEYQFDTNQEFRNKRFKQALVLGTDFLIVQVNSVDNETGLITVASKQKLPSNITLISFEYFNPKKLQAAIWSCAKQFADARKISAALSTFLCRQAPEISADLLLQIDASTGDEKLALITQAISDMQSTFLSIQGPPGTGKTYTASRVIYALMKQGKRIGVSSNSHAAINNLLGAVATLVVERNTPMPIAKIQREYDDLFHQYPIEQIGASSADKVYFSAEGLVGFTVWGAQQVYQELDYLFVDEAGQVALANLIAMSHVAPNIVVMGDQMQLPQPVQGAHPGNSGQSILDYLLQEQRTIPASKGIFLNRSYRMHENVNQFISQLIYEDRLENDPACNNQAIMHHVKNGLPTNGIVSLSLKHEGNKQYSPEEVDVIRNLVIEITQAEFVDKEGNSKPIGANDILVVAPYNYQVNELSKAVGEDARVGTVDLFQGQEAPVVILSMTASRAIDSPRGPEFLLNINRLNVAISRAKALAIVVHSEKLLEGAAANIDDIKRFNLFQTIIDCN